MTVVFVDFDGVLHPLECGQESRFCYLRALEAVLRDYPFARLVVCSEWRKGTAWEEILAFFAPDIRARVLGATPALSAEVPPPGLRQREALEFLSRAGLEDASWIALDDLAANWESGEPRLIVCADGFFEREERLLRAALEGLA